MTRFSDASHTGNSVTLGSDRVRLDLHERPRGWGFGELYAPAADGADRFLGVLEHLGEIDIARTPHPIQLVAEEGRREGNRVTFDLVPQDLFDLEDFRGEGYDEFPEVSGTLTLALAGGSRISYALDLETNVDVELRRLRGPWLRIGADAPEFERHDAIFPGIEWLTDDEWSSSNAYLEEPYATRLTPHPHKVAIPTLAVSSGTDAVSLSWEPGRLDDRLGSPQPVFASPNFVDRRNDSLLGLMLPGADGALAENELACDGVAVDAGRTLSFGATIALHRGSSLDAVTAAVRRRGLPDLPEQRYEYAPFVDWIAACYATNLWIDGEGFGVDVGSEDGGRPEVPAFLERYCEYEAADPELVSDLRAKMEWCERHAGTEEPDLGRPLKTIMRCPDDEVDDLATSLLSHRRPDGAFVYEPGDRHRSGKFDWLEHTRPIGHDGETELGFCVDAAAAMLVAADRTGESAYADAAVETLEFAMRFDKPAGDDWWETPIHAPNLLAGGKAALAYELAHRETGLERYRNRAAYWLRSLLPFTHLREPAGSPMVYYTKPCFATSIWTAISWVDHHVIWEVLAAFDLFAAFGIDPTDVDRSVDWDRYHRGVVRASFQWILDSRADDAYLERFVFPEERLHDGEFDGLYVDIHDPVSGEFFAGPLYPDLIGRNVLHLLRSGE